MNEFTTPNLNTEETGLTPPSAEISARAEKNLSTVTNILHDIDKSQVAPIREKVETAYQNQLVQARLGVASSLYAALRCKHPSTAAHSLRVAFCCSAWGDFLGVDEALRESLEIAALLHDVGKIGVPDEVLLKQGALSSAEFAIMDRHRPMGVEILHGCCNSEPVLDITRHSGDWFDGGKGTGDKVGDELPYGARMLAIVDAFDAMTTDQVYRPAMSTERAANELFANANTQFDPVLVANFCDFLRADQTEICESVSNRWLKKLDPANSPNSWAFSTKIEEAKRSAVETLFQDKLLDSMRDGVAYVDANYVITYWNCGLERLTGISGESVVGQRWSPKLLEMRSEGGAIVLEEECPVTSAIRTGVQLFRRMTIRARDDDRLTVNAQVIPVMQPDGQLLGAALLAHDASSESSLEERCLDLHERATKDPLTQIANRAEFDRVHLQFVQEHLQDGLPCSLIITDIDFFKRVNDTYGHQAGDEALKLFAKVLKSHCRPGDLVARYGGEEFVILCADCKNSAASKRSEQIRAAFRQLPMPMLKNQCITSSFGVTEVQPGDSPETMLARADRALLLAKERGRNCVVQLGDGIDIHQQTKPSRWRWWQRQRTNIGPRELLHQRGLITPVPLKMAVEKIRGFISDHSAKIESVQGNQLIVKLEGSGLPFMQRSSDRKAPLLVELHFFEQGRRREGSLEEIHGASKTWIDVAIRPLKDRDRRQKQAVERAREIAVSLQSYLMATEEPAANDKDTVRRASNLHGTWLSKQV